MRDDIRASPLAFDRRDLAAMGILAACVLAMFWKVLFTGELFFYRDIFNYTYPHARFIQEVCRQGQLPYWNPYLNYGQPVLANPNFLFFYPTTLFIILFPIDFAYTMHFVLHFVIGAAGTYWLARSWNQTRTAAVVASLFFALSGPVLSTGNFYNHVACAAWIPWALFLTDRALETRSRRPWILLTLVFALQFLAGEPFTLLATFGLSFVYTLHRAGTIRPLASRSNLRLLGTYILVGLAMLGLCAVQLFPSLDFLEHSRRAEGMVYNEITYWSFHPLLLLDVVLPDFFGRPLESPSLWTWALNGLNAPYFPSLFVGFVPLYFALAGWAISRERRRRLVAGATLTLGVLALGRFTPAFALAFLSLPPLGLVRFPFKLLVPTMLLVALLAGWGFDALRRPEDGLGEGRKKIFLPLQVILGCVLAAWLASLLVPAWITAPAQAVFLHAHESYAHRSTPLLTPAQITQTTTYLLTMIRLNFPGLAGFALGGLVLAMGFERRKTWAHRAVPAVVLLGLGQMAMVNDAANPTVPKAFYSYRPPVLDQVENSISPYRVGYVPNENGAVQDVLPPERFINFDSIPETKEFSPPALWSFRDRLVLVRGSMLLKVDAVLNSDVERSLPPFLYDFFYFVVFETPGYAAEDCLLGRTNVKYEIMPRPRLSPALREIGRVFNGSPTASYLYENKCALPRTYVADTAVYSGDRFYTLSRMSATDFDFQHQVIVFGEPQPEPSAVDPNDKGHVDFLSRKPNEVVLEAELPHPGYVVLLDRYDPNWHATVDDREVPVLRANWAFRAVRVEAGKHEVRFYYRQRGLLAGMIVSLATLALLGVAFVRRARLSG